MFYNVSIAARMSSSLASRMRMCLCFHSTSTSASCSTHVALHCCLQTAFVNGAALFASYSVNTPEEAPLRVEAPTILYVTLAPAASSSSSLASSALPAAAPSGAQFAPVRARRSADQPAQSSLIIGSPQSQQQPPSLQQPHSVDALTSDAGVRYAEGLQLRRVSGIRGRILRYYAVVVTAAQAAGSTPDAFLASKVRLHPIPSILIIPLHSNR